MTKCWDIDYALDTFFEDLEKASSAPTFTEKLGIIFKSIKNIIDNLNPEDVDDFFEEVNNAKEEFPEMASVLTDARKVQNPDFKVDTWENRHDKANDEESDEEKLNTRARIRKDFMSKQFKDPSSRTSAGRAMLYFQRDANQKLLKTFLLDRDAGTLVAKEDIPQRVQQVKLELLETIVDYLKDVGYKGNPKLFDANGVFHDVFESDQALKVAIDTYLTIGKSFSTQQLKDAYENFRGEKGNYEKSKKFIEAYNAKVLLNNFDTITTMLLGTIVKPNPTTYGNLSNDTYETKIHKATNMWGNGFGDDVENIADVISDVTQKLIGTSRKYSWKGGPMRDQYLTFLEFNHIVTKIKKLHRDPISKTTVFDKSFWDSGDNSLDNISSTTKKSLDTLRQIKTEQGYSNPNPTFEDLLSFISDNPLRHLHSIWDLLCNTDLVDRFTNIDSQDKNLIWTVGKELFGTWPNETDAKGNPISSRSLFDLHQNSNNDRIFEIITLVADSIFADSFLQYYEDQEGTLKVRLLQDYAVSLVKNQIMQDMRQTHGMFDPDKFKRFLSDHKVQLDYRNAVDVYPLNNPKKIWKVENPEYDKEVAGSKPKINQKAQFLKKVTIPVGTLMKIEYQEGKLVPLTSKNVYTKDYQAIWKSKEFRQVVKDTIGKDFDTDIELASAYEETFKQPDVISGGISINYKNLVTDLARLCGAVTFNQSFNNIVVPTILKNGSRERNKRNVEILRDIQYEGQPLPRINMETGSIEMLSDINKEAYLSNLGLGQATVHGLLTSAQVKTGEGTALASQSLSCLRASHAYQMFTQNKRKSSATNHSTYVNNENGFFRDSVGRREFKSESTVKVNTDTSSVESFELSFLGGFVGAHIVDSDSSTINRNGNAFIVPDVNSDKTRQEELAIQLNAESLWQPGKHYISMTDSELEYEMKMEFGQMYDKIVKNINKENLRLAELLGIDLNDFKGKPAILNYSSILSTITDKLCPPEELLNEFEKKNPIAVSVLRKEGKNAADIIKSLEENNAKVLGKIRKKIIVSEMHKTLVNYNRIHRRKPIQTCIQIHYLFDDNGRLVPNDTLRALWGRFNGNSELNKVYGITDLYPENHKEASTIEGYFKYEKDLRCVEELLNDGFEIYLLGAKAKEKQPEIAYLREKFPSWVTKSGKMALAKRFIPERFSIGDVFINPQGAKVEITNIKVDKDLNTTYEVVLINPDGSSERKDKSVAAVEFTLNDPNVTYIPAENKPGTWEFIEDVETLKKYKDDPRLRDFIKVHPMLSKLNRISYLAAQLYTSAVGGAHYVYKGGGKNVLEEEASRWLASNKRNVCYASTVHKYQNKTLTGPPKFYQIAPIEDIKAAIYTIMGDLTDHKPIDGGMFVLSWLPELENNALGGEAAGLDKKLFGTYYFEDIAAGGIIKTAGFAITNQRMRRSEAYRALCKNMTDRIWLKEFATDDGSDIEELIDITRDYNGNTINWVLDGSGVATYYYRNLPDGGCGRFRLENIEAVYTNGIEERVFKGPVPLGWRPTNKYKIYEYPVNANGEVNKRHPDIQAMVESGEVHPILRTDPEHKDGIYTINTNWLLYNTIFGGFNSLSLNSHGILEPSEHSISQMVYALNNIGYKRDTEHNDKQFGDERYTVEDIEKIETQDDVWQPLKYSDIQYAPNIGALKSTQMNVNPEEGLYKDTYLNAMNIMMALLGIQLDKEHHADNSEVSMPTQIIQACANKGYTIEYTSQLYNSLSTLTELAIEDCMKGIEELLPGHENKGTLITEVTKIIVDKLIHSLDDNAALDAVFDFLIKKVEAGGKIEASDLQGHPIPWSDAKLYNKVYNDLASHLTNNAIKMKFPGTLAVICPTERVERMYGNRRLNSFADPDNNLSEILGKELYQNKIRETELIYDLETHGDNTWDKLSLASNLDTQHHYWVEYSYPNGEPVIDEHGNIYKESYTMETPLDYYKLRDLIAYGGSGNIALNDMSGKPIQRGNIQVSKVYENVMQGRELGAYNVRFTTEEANQQFNIFDLDSVKNLFDFNDLDLTLSNAKNLLDSEIIDRGFASTKILQYMYLKTPEEANVLEKTMAANPDLDITEAIDLTNKEVTEAFIPATFKICKGLTYKALERDLFKISKDYNGDRKVYVHNTLMTVNPDSIKTQAYELIMPKVYQTKFGLEEQDQIDKILADKDFFTKRAIQRVKELKVSDDCFHYELKNFNGQHIYIWDSRIGGIPSSFRNKNFYPVEVSKGKFERHDIDGNFMHPLASGNDRIMKVGDLGYEVIVTDNPAFYMENLNYNIPTFSNKNVSEKMIQELVDTLSESDSNKAKRFVKTFTAKNGKLRKFNQLLNRNDAINIFTLEKGEKEPPELTYLRKAFIKEGNELWASFDKSLDIIAGRIPAQSLQSFMPQRVVAFDNNDINTAYVSTFLLFLQGSNK